MAFMRHVMMRIHPHKVRHLAQQRVPLIALLLHDLIHRALQPLAVARA